MKNFEVRDDLSVDVAPQALFEAVTAGTAGWMWALEAPEPRVGGTGAFGSLVTVWDPPHHYGNRSEGEGGWFNALDYVIEPREGGSFLRYVHAGMLEGDWDTQYDGIVKHTAFYLATLKQYVEQLGGAPATHVGVDGPVGSHEAGSLERVVTALGAADASPGDTVRVEVPGVPAFDAVVDYRGDHFLGLTAPDLLVRVFGREAFGAGTAISLHGVSGVLDPDVAQPAWQAWLDGLFA